MTNRPPLHVPRPAGTAAEANFSSAPDDFAPLMHDQVPVRSLESGDLAAIARIDRKNIGRDRTEALRRKMDEALMDSAIRVSLVAELDGTPVGFIMARVDFGEFGRAEPVAVLDTIGVDPGYSGRAVGTALLSQLLMNLAGLKIELVETQVSANNIDLLGFFYRSGFAPAQRLAFHRRVE